MKIKTQLYYSGQSEDSKKYYLQISDTAPTIKAHSR